MNFDIEEEEKTTKKKKKESKSKFLMYLSIFFAVLTVVLIIIYITSNRNSKPTQTVAPPTVVEEKEKEVKVVNVVDETSNQRPIAVMLDNNIGNIPHAGLMNSYLNYEIIVEGGLTRIMAVYKDSNVQLIGPIRSARHYFLDYAMESDAIFIHYGWSPQAEKDIAKFGINNINGMTEKTAFNRDTKLKSPHNVFSIKKNIDSYLSTKGYNLSSDNWRLLKYSAEPVSLIESTSETNSTGTALNTDARQASRVYIEYSSSENRTYSYDSSNEYYLRSSNGAAHIDRMSNQQLHYKNIIIEKVENKTIDAEGRQELTTCGTGTGFYITNGYARPITWSKASRNGKTRFTYSDGTEVVFNDGNTFIQIVPITSNITIQ